MRKMKKDLAEIDALKNELEDINAEVKKVWPDIDSPFGDETFYQLAVKRMKVADRVGRKQQK